MPRTRATLLWTVALWLALSAPLAHAQVTRTVRGVSDRGTVYAELHDLARAAGVVATEAGDALTYRGELGVVTFFAGSSAGLRQSPGDGGPTEVSFSAPVVVVGSDWWAPLDALEYLGVQPLEGAAGLRLAGGGEADLAFGTFTGAPLSETVEAADGAWDVTELGPGVTVLRLYAGDVELSLLDLTLLPLARPELTAQVDAAMAAAWGSGAGADNVLLLQVVALADEPWDATLRFSQAGRVLEVRHPYRLLLQQGAPDAVGPAAPVAGVVLLPASFDLYRPLEVEWAGVSAEVAFRR